MQLIFNPPVGTDPTGEWDGLHLVQAGDVETYNAFINGQISESTAARLAEAAPGEDSLQRVGMREIQERKKSVDYAIGVMQALQATQTGSNSGGDMSGFLFDMMDDSALDDARRMAEYATRMQRALARMVKSAEGAVKNPEAFSKVTKSEIRSELKAQETLARLKWAQSRWNNYGLYTELAEEARNWDEKSPVTLNIDTLPALPLNGSGTSTFSVTADAGLKEAIHKACLNKLGDKTINRFCSLPPILAYFGEKPQGIYAKGYVLKKLHNKHYLSEQQIYEVAQKLGDPLFVFRDDGNYIFLLEMTAANRKGNESPVMTALAMEKKDGHLLLSAYPIDNLQKIEQFIDEKKLLYSRYTLEEWKQKGEAWHTMPTRRPLSSELLRALVKTLPQGNIPTSQDIVKWQNEKKATFSITSAEYDISGIGSMLEEKAFTTLLNDARKETPATLAAQGMGRISALMQAICKRLPSKYRPKTAAALRLMEHLRPRTGKREDIQKQRPSRPGMETSHTGRNQRRGAGNSGPGLPHPRHSRAQPQPTGHRPVGTDRRHHGAIPEEHGTGTYQKIGSAAGTRHPEKRQTRPRQNEIGYLPEIPRIHAYGRSHGRRNGSRNGTGGNPA